MKCLCTTLIYNSHLEKTAIEFILDRKQVLFLSGDSTHFNKEEIRFWGHNAYAQLRDRLDCGGKEN